MPRYFMLIMPLVQRVDIKSWDRRNYDEHLTDTYRVRVIPQHGSPIMPSAHIFALGVDPNAELRDARQNGRVRDGIDVQILERRRDH